MYLSAPKRFSVIFAYIVVIILVGSLILRIAFDVENPWLWVAIFSVLTVPLLYAKISELPYLKWKNSYYVGVEEIDYDHKQLVSLINQVVTASQDHLAENIVPNILDELIDYTKYHLRREEKLMEEYEYPERVKHAAQHVKFIDKINGFHTEYESKRKMKNEVVFDFLRCWLIKHISNTDQDLGAFIKAKRSNPDSH